MPRALAHKPRDERLPDDAGVTDVIWVILGVLIQIPVFFLMIWAFQIYIATSSLAGVVDTYVAQPIVTRFTYALAVHRSTTGGNDAGLLSNAVVGPLIPHGLSVAYGWDGLLGPGTGGVGPSPVRWQIVEAQGNVSGSFFFPLRLTMFAVAQVTQVNRVAVTGS